MPTKGGLIAVWKVGGKLFVANAGDSMSLVAVAIFGKVHVVYVTREDTPDLSGEKKRLQSMGCTISESCAELSQSSKVSEGLWQGNMWKICTRHHGGCCERGSMINIYVTWCFVDIAVVSQSSLATAIDMSSR